MSTIRPTIQSWVIESKTVYDRKCSDRAKSVFQVLLPSKEYEIVTQFAEEANEEGISNLCESVKFQTGR